jgi:hypothetical protein
MSGLRYGWKLNAAESVMAEFGQTILVVAALAAPFDMPEPARTNWCTPGYTVMIPDGREGFVSSVEGDICRIITDGEAYVTPLPHYIVEPVYPQKFAARAYR